MRWVDSLCSSVVGIGSSLHDDLTAWISLSIIVAVGMVKESNLYIDVVSGGSVRGGRELIIICTLFLKYISNNAGKEEVGSGW